MSANLVLAPGSWVAHRDGDPGCGELHGELAALPLKLLGPLLLADPEPDLVEDVSDLSSNDPLLANIPVRTITFAYWLPTYKSVNSLVCDITNEKAVGFF